MPTRTYLDVADAPVAHIVMGWMDRGHQAATYCGQVWKLVPFGKDRVIKQEIAASRDLCEACDKAPW